MMKDTASEESKKQEGIKREQEDVIAMYTTMMQIVAAFYLNAHRQHRKLLD